MPDPLTAEMLIANINSHPHAALILQVLRSASSNVVSYTRKPPGTHAYFTSLPGWKRSECRQNRRILQQWEHCQSVWWTEEKIPTINVALEQPPQVVKDALRILNAEAMPQRQKKSACG